MKECLWSIVMSDRKSYENCLPHLSCRDGSNEYSTLIERKEFERKRKESRKKRINYKEKMEGNSWEPMAMWTCRKTREGNKDRGMAMERRSIAKLGRGE